MENMVDYNQQTEASDDMVPNFDLQADSEQQQEGDANDLDLLSALTQQGEVEPEEQSKPSVEEAPTAKKEPGWIKQRVDKAVSKAVQEARAQMESDFEKRLAPIRDNMINRQAQELVDRGEIKNIATAKEYLLLKQGTPKIEEMMAQESAMRTPKAQEQQLEQPQENIAHLKLLTRQVEKIRKQNNIDLMPMLAKDETMRQRILTGEIDFYDVLAQMERKNANIPTPSRSTNGSATKKASIAGLNDEEFSQLERNLKLGIKYNVK